jgi:hypothetical protein
MNARDEAQDLMANPLPTVVIMDPLTQVWELDNIIAKMESALNERRSERQQLLDYAVQNRIVEDDRCRLDVKVRRTRTLDVGRFRMVFPEEYMIACDIERKDLEEKMRALGEKIPITLIDKLIKKPALEASGAVTVKEAISYGVIRK